jgi:CSLREA domain-containing protein
MTIRALLASSLLTVLLLAFGAPAALANGFSVNATDDNDGPCTTTHCSLRQAINAANASPGADIIVFNLPITVQARCSGFPIRCVFVPTTSPIQLATSLPRITDTLTIDGTTQPDFSGSPLVELRGVGATTGLTVAGASDGSVIRALAVNGFGTGIKVASSNNVLTGNWIGLDMNGLPRGNGTGIVVQGNGNTIGGSTSGTANIISANTGTGVLFCVTCIDLTTPGNGSNNRLAGNLIGTNPSGTGAMGNQDGVVVAGKGFLTQFGIYDPNVGSNIIGGGVFAEGNVISGNRDSGIELNGVSNTKVGENRIGLNPDGTAAIPNGGAGLVINDAPNTIVGTLVGTRPCVIFGSPAICPDIISGPNLIGANTGDGVRMLDTVNTHDIALKGNFIGTNSDGTADLGNGGNGVFVSGSFPDRNNVIGDSTDSNRIAFNHGAGVSVNTFGGDGQSIRFNRIASNVGLGIDLGPTGVTSGGTPVLSSVVSSATSTTIKGSLTTVGNSNPYTLDFYSNAACDPSGFGEGERYIGSTSVVVSFTGTVTFGATFNTPLLIGSVVTATSTDPFGATSEFGKCEVVTSDGSTGTFGLAPRVTSVKVGDPVAAQLTWTVPAPRVWRNLATIDFRVADDSGTAIQVHWDQASNTFSLAGQPASFAPGTPGRLETEWAVFDPTAARVVGSGPTGPSVTLTLPISFKPRAAGHTYQVSVAASDDFGHVDPFLATGVWTVTR